MRRGFWLLLLFLLLPMRVMAVDITEDLAAVYGADRLSEGLTAEQEQLLSDTDPSENFFQNVMDLLSKVLLHGKTDLQAAAGTGAKILAISMLCGLCGTLICSTATNAVPLAGVLAICSVCISDVGSLIRLGTNAMEELSAYGTLMLPVLSAAAVSAGSVTGAPMQYAIAVLFSDVLLTLFTKLLLPFLYILLGLAVADCVSSTISFGRIRGLVVWIIKTAMKTILYAYLGFLTVTQVIAGTADAMTVKAAKLTLSGVVPVVGSILSDASETLLVSAALLKNTIGTVGLLTVLAICILPFLRIAIQLLMLKLTAAVAEITAPKPLISMIDAIAETISLLLGILGSSVFILFIAVVCSMKAVGYG